MVTSSSTITPTVDGCLVLGGTISDSGNSYSASNLPFNQLSLSTYRVFGDSGIVYPNNQLVLVVQTLEILWGHL